MNIYRLRTTAICPVDGQRDHYDVEVRANHILKVEDIRACFDSWANKPVFQEVLARSACITLGADEVNITGHHPSPVRIESRGTL